MSLHHKLSKKWPIKCWAILGKIKSSFYVSEYEKAEYNYIVNYGQVLMPRITTRGRGRPLLIFLGKCKFLAFLAAFEILVLNKIKFLTDSEKLLFLPKYSFGSDTRSLFYKKRSKKLSSLDFPFLYSRFLFLMAHFG